MTQKLMRYRSYRPILFAMAAVLFTAEGLAQTPTQNYVLTRTYRTPGGKVTQEGNANQYWGTPEQVQTQVSYFDGLGRKRQDVAVYATPAKGDLVMDIGYDNMFRPNKQYLPAPQSSGDGSFRSSAGGDAYYNSNQVNSGTDRSYTETLYENSSLSRVTQQRAPGISGNGIRARYLVNGNGIKKYRVGENGQLIFNENSPEYYPNASLQLLETKDEDNKKVEEFTDMHGRVVARRVADNLITYYVYDPKGQLRYVLQPKYQVASESNKLELFAFQYHYDGWGRMTSKRIPGQGQFGMVYDLRDNLTRMTDGLNQIFTFDYDQLNRQVGVNQEVELIPSPLILRHFDDYAGGVGFPQSGWDNELELNETDHFIGDPTSNNVVGSQTWEKVAVLNANGRISNDLLAKIYYYDRKGRLVQTIRQLHDLGGDAYERVSYKLDFTGNVVEERTTQSTTNAVYRLHKTFSYDHQGRLSAVQHKLERKDGLNWTLLKDYQHAGLDYNAVGLLKRKKLHGAKQVQGYKYTPRGWLAEEANEVGNTFQVNLNFDNNGNINTLGWATHQHSGSITGILYDDANRLRGSENGKLKEYGITYDENGNILTLKRGNNGDIDNLTYNYGSGGNQLRKVHDTGNNEGFTNGSNGEETSDYEYDGNGNLTKDQNRGLFKIRYNLFNLPAEMYTSENALKMSYLYGADGTKLKTEVTGGSFVRKYAGAFEYDGSGNLTRIGLEEGQLIRTGVGSYQVNYYLRDHLGNVRQVLAENTNAMDVAQETEYYPFGLSVSRSGDDAVNRYQFLNREKQPETGYIDLMARFYDPTIGRFMQVDPVTETQENYSTYQYGWNNPILRSDPNGQYPDGGDDPFLAARLIATAFFDTKHAIINIGAKLLGSDKRADYKVEGGQQVFETEITTGATGNVVQELIGTIADIATVATAGTNPVNPGSLLSKTSSTQVIKAGKEVASEIAAYKRPSGSVTNAQRASVQGKPCVDCGTTGKMVADHKRPLVKEHYETGTIDKKNMRSVDAVQPQCPTCSAKQGAEMSRYSREQKKKNGLD